MAILTSSEASVQWLQTTHPTTRELYTISPSNSVVFASRRTLSFLFAMYCVFLFDNGYTIPDYPSWMNEEYTEESVSPRTVEGARVSEVPAHTENNSSSISPEATARILSHRLFLLLNRAENIYRALRTSSLFLHMRYLNSLIWDIASVLEERIDEVYGLWDRVQERIDEIESGEDVEDVDYVGSGWYVDTMEEVIEILLWDCDEFERDPMVYIARRMNNLAFGTNAQIHIN